MTRKKRKGGQQPKIGAKRRTYNLTDEVVAYYSRVGDGNVTLGIERVAERGIRSERPHADSIARR